MRTSHLFTIALGLCGVAACGDETSSTTPTTTTTTTTTGTGTGGGGTGGAGGTTSSAGGMGGGGGAQGGGGSTPGIDCSAGADHLLISEVMIGSDVHEYVEIHNPGSSAVKLHGYYLSDNATYFGVAKGNPWNPTESVKGTDFLAGFPADAEIGPGEYLVVAAGKGFEAAFKTCPAYTVGDADLQCNGDAVPHLVSPQNGSGGTQLGSMFSNNGEMVVLFCWDGVSDTVKDVDYVRWGEMKTQTVVDKSNEAGYQADTPEGSQKSLAKPSLMQGQPGGYARCGTGEPGEKSSGGNGVAGHDETSEDWTQSFGVIATPSPGAKNACVVN